MKTITKLICLLFFVVFAWSAPALELPIDEITEESTEGNMIVQRCPLPKCMAITQPCDNIQMSYIVINGQKCPMCRYCASSTPQES